MKKVEKETKVSKENKSTQSKHDSAFTWRPFEEFFKTGKNSHV